MTEDVQLKLTMLPESPGCYLMRAKGEIIYVGKAVNLKNRVRSYFQSARAHTPKVSAMVAKIDDFDIMLCDTNLEALILECNLIKLHKPYYNILLRDDKHYPYVRVDTAQDYPRVELVRRIGHDGAKYFGPFIGATVVREMMDVLRQVFPLRTCTQAIQPDKPRRPCIHFEIGQCLAPCANNTTPQAYHQVVGQVLAFLQGKSGEVLEGLRRQMQEAAAAMQYERAGLLRDRMRVVEQLLERQRAISTGGGNQDIIALAQDGLDAMVEVLHVRGGKMVGGDHFAMERAGDEPPEAVLESFALQYYDDTPMLPRELLFEALSPEARESLETLFTQRRAARVAVHVPQRGEKRALILMAKKNAQDALAKRNAQARQVYARTLGAAAALGEALGLATPPRRIEGFDISNTQGAYSVASMVVMIDGAPANKQYRHFRIQTVEGANDFASMNEVLGRRFRHGLLERAEREAAGLDAKGGKFSDMPDLVLIDGGPQQLAFALRAMREAGADVPMFGLAKRLEEIYLPDTEAPILLDRHSPALHLIQRLRDEAHRFAITHHRAVRGKAGVRSQLEDIPGIGPARRKALLKHFRTMEALRAASADDIAQVEGMTRPAAEAVHAFLRAKDKH